MRILITGGKGMLARTLVAELGKNPDYTLLAPGHTELDITDPMSVTKVFGEFEPEVVLHCAAFTKVDLCESEQARAQEVNVQGSANIAMACKQSNARLIAFSTDYVFDGESGPYNEFARPTGGINVYGQSKWAAERTIRLDCPNHVIARVSWLYGPGGPSFVHTMLRLAGRPCIRVVDDQRGCPTSTLAVAGAITEILQRPHLLGTFHLACQGETTWYGLAREIFALAGIEQNVEPCTSAEYVTPAKRPSNSCLVSVRMKDCGLSPMPHWQESLKSFLAKELPTLGK